MSMSAIQIHVGFISTAQRLLCLNAMSKKKKNPGCVLKILLLLVSEILNTVCQKESHILRAFPVH